MIGAGHAWDLAAVDQLLPPPRIDSLRTDLQVKGDLGHWPARGHQIQDLPPELCRIALRHTVLHGLLYEGSSSNPTPENRGTSEPPETPGRFNRTSVFSLDKLWRR